MNDYLEVEGMLKTVTTELKEWKMFMEDLAGAFYTRYPSTKRTGWTLHLKRCARAKACDMCPHSIYWVRYAYRKFTDNKKTERIKEGKDAPNTFLAWDNNPEGKSMDGLPKTLKLPRGDMVVYVKYEAVRTEIMRQHRALASLRVKLLARVRNRRVGYSIQTNYFDDGIVRDYLTTMLPINQIKIAVIYSILELWKRH